MVDVKSYERKASNDMRGLGKLKLIYFGTEKVADFDTIFQLRVKGTILTEKLKSNIDGKMYKGDFFEINWDTSLIEKELLERVKYLFLNEVGKNPTYFGGTASVGFPNIMRTKKGEELAKW
jgi:hypothetical protein